MMKTTDHNDQIRFIPPAGPRPRMKRALCNITLAAISLSGLLFVQPQAALAQDASQSQNEATSQEETQDRDIYTDEDGLLLHKAGTLHSLYHELYLEASASLSILTDKEDSSYFAETLGFNLTFGFGLSDNIMLFLTAEQNMWRKQETEADTWDNGVFNIGIGILWQIYAPHIFLRFSSGASILTFDTSFDDMGTAGFYVDIAPIDLQWKWLDDHLVLSVRPIAVHIDMPVIREPMIRYVQYRTVIGFGYQW